VLVPVDLNYGTYHLIDRNSCTSKGFLEAGYIPKKYVDDAHDLFFK